MSYSSGFVASGEGKTPRETSGMGHGCWQEWLGARGSCAAAGGSGARTSPGEGEFPHDPMEGKAKGKWSRRQEELREGRPGTTPRMCGMVQGSLLLPGQLGRASQSQLFHLPLWFLLLTGGSATGCGSRLSSLCRLFTGGHTQPRPPCQRRCQPGEPGVYRPQG